MNAAPRPAFFRYVNETGHAGLEAGMCGRKPDSVLANARKRGFQAVLFRMDDGSLVRVSGRAAA